MAFRCNKNLYCFWQQSQRTSSGWPHLASLTIETLREGHLPFSTYHCSLWLSRLSFYQDCSGIICTIAESVLFCSGRLCLCDFRRDSWFLYVTWCPMNIVRKMSLSKLKHWSSLRFIKPLKYKHEKKTWVKYEPEWTSLGFPTLASTSALVSFTRRSLYMGCETCHSEGYFAVSSTRLWYCSSENLGAMTTQTRLPIQMIVCECDYIRPPAVRLFGATMIVSASSGSRSKQNNAIQKKK